MQYAPLSTVSAQPIVQGFAVYFLKHLPTGKVFVGSSGSIKAKLQWWHYAINNPAAQAKIPMKVLELLALSGNKPDEWGYCLLDDPLPRDFKPKAQDVARPEWPYIARLLDTNPDVLLNSVRLRAEKPIEVRSTRGIAPTTYLGIKLGLRRGTKYRELPPHSWKDDPRVLPEWGTPFVSFGCYLFRSCNGMQPRNFNPREERIKELYFKWLAHVPATERYAVEHDMDVSVQQQRPVRREVPYTCQMALAVPLPRAYNQT